MRYVVGADMGHAALQEMVAILRGGGAGAGAEGAAGLLRGAVFYINMALWGPRRVPTLKVSFLAVLPAFLKVSAYLLLPRHRELASHATFPPGAGGKPAGGDVRGGGEHAERGVAGAAGAVRARLGRAAQHPARHRATRQYVITRGGPSTRRYNRSRPNNKNIFLLIAKIF